MNYRSEEKVRVDIDVSEKCKRPPQGGNIWASDYHKKWIFPPKRD